MKGITQNYIKRLNLLTHRISEVHVPKLLEEGEVQKQRQWYFQDGVQEVQRKTKESIKAVNSKNKI